MIKIKYFVATFVLSVLIGVNVWNSTAPTHFNELNVSDIENQADGWEWNSFSDWFSQGITADEVIEKVSCTHTRVERNQQGQVIYSETKTHDKINCYDGGNENCTPTSCPY